MGFDELQYKPHRDEPPAERQLFVDSGFQVVAMEGRCVEEVVGQAGASTVASFVSSALFNLRCVYGDRLKCIAFLDDLIPVAKHNFLRSLQDARHLFSDAGVSVL
jgi:hypothetical protein